jgi:hypothetical protein
MIALMFGVVFASVRDRRSSWRVPSSQLWRWLHFPRTKCVRPHCCLILLHVSEAVGARSDTQKPRTSVVLACIADHTKATISFFA